MKKHYLFLSLILCSFFATLHAQTTRYVKTDGTGTGSSWADANNDLQTTITNSATGDIIFVKKGEYLLTGSISMKEGVKIYGSFSGTENTLAQRDLSSFSNDVNNATILKSNGNQRVITNNVTMSSATVLDGFVITGGRNVDKGGGVYNNNASPTLHNLIITDNIITGGNGTGGINGGSVYGGGIYNEGTSSPIIFNVIISGNKANGGKGGDSAYTGDGLISGGHGGNAYGGGIYNGNTASPILTNVLLINNSTTGGQGGKKSPLDAGNGGKGHGGGIYNANSSAPILINVTISKNMVNAGNAGDSDAVNGSSFGGGVYSETSSEPKIYNTIIFENSADNNPGIYDISASPIIQHSLVQGRSNTDNGNISATNVIGIDIFNDATNGDYSLVAFSLAINAGENSLYSLGNISADKDLAKNSRLYNGNPTPDVIDMGAYEFQAEPVSYPVMSGVLYVNKMATGNKTGDSWANAIPELADALVRANFKKSNFTTTPLQIWVAGGTYKPQYSPEDGANFVNDNRNNAFLLINNVQLYGGFAGTETTLTQRDLSLIGNKTILSGDFNDNDIISGFGNTLRISNNTENAYHVFISTGDVDKALIDGVTIKGGNANNSGNISINSINALRNSGGGIYINQSSPKMSNVSITRNAASGINGGDAFGGGMYINQSLSVIKNVSITNNTVSGGIGQDASGVFDNGGNGGNAFGGGVYSSNSTPAFINVTTAGNTAINGAGGSSIAGSSGSNGNGNGGGVYNLNSSLNLVNTIIWDNSATNGKNILSINNQPVISYSLIEGVDNTSNNGLDGTDNNNNPKFTDTTNSDFSLLKTSSAVNMGSNTAYVNAGGSLTTDKDVAGNKRVFQSTIDMGAYESQVAIITPDANNIVYVSKNGTGIGSGDSWANAIPELADALVWAKQNYNASWATTPLQIFVAKGTYKPLYSPEDGANFGTDKGRDNSFLMVNNVQLYGGFDPANGIDDLTDSRILPTSGNTGTILSGDVNDNDESDFVNNSENLIRIIVSSGAVGKALINGFTITGANGENNNNITVNGNPVYQCSGAGIYNSISSPLYENLLLYENFNTESGGGMFSYQSSATLRNIVFRNNKAKDGGAIANQDNSSPVLLNVSFIENEATANGGAIYNVDNSKPTFVNSTVHGNTDTGGGDGIFSVDTSSPTILNSIVWGVVHGTLTAKNSIIKDATDTTNGNLDATGITDTKIFTDATNGDYTLKKTSPAVNAGNNTLYTNAGGTLSTDKDLAGNPRVYVGGLAPDKIDMGAYELQQDITAPSITVLSPVDDATGISIGSNLTITFNENVQIGTGNITLYDAADDSVVETIDVTSTVVSITEKVVIINPTVDLKKSKTYYVQIANTAFKDLKDNAFEGIADKTTWSFATVLKVSPTLTFADFSKTYGDANFDLTASSNSTGAVSYEIIAGGTGSATLSGTNNKTVTLGNAGTVTVKATVAADANYLATNKTITLTINKAELTITADAKSKVYGDANPPLTFTYSGFKNTDDATDLTKTPVASTTVTSASSVGDYDIEVAFATASKSAGAPENYSFKFVKGTLTITAKAITITADAKTKVYGETDPTLTYTMSASLIGSDALTGALTRATGENVGVYAISSTLSAGANYNITFVSKNFTITKATQTITFGAVTHSNKDVFDLTAMSSSGLPITYISSDTNIATVSGNTVTVLSAGTTTITAKQEGNSNYEAATSVNQVLTIITLGVEDNIALSEVIKLYPNPTINFIKIDVGTIEKASIKIFDLSGKLVLDKKNYNPKEVLNISSLKIGVYFVNIESDKGNTMKKFIKKE